MTGPETLLGATRGKLLERLRRGDAGISVLATALGVTDNAVRAHIAALERDGLVAPAGLVRGVVGKPARLYRITARGEALFPKAYALVLAELLQVLEARTSTPEVVEILRTVGQRAAQAQLLYPDLDTAARVDAAADALRQLGGDVEVRRNGSGWLLQGYACPLAEAVSGHPHVCALAQALVEELTQQPVTECCEKGERPRCAFKVAG